MLLQQPVFAQSNLVSQGLCCEHSRAAVRDRGGTQQGCAHPFEGTRR